MGKVVFPVEMKIAEARILASLLRIAAWREFWKADTQGRPECLRNEGLFKDLASDIQHALNEQTHTPEEVTE